jgi:hypothetical protein
MLDGLTQDPEVDTRWSTPNQIRDAALGEGKVTDRPKVLGTNGGGDQTITITNGNSAEVNVYRSGKANDPTYTKQLADGQRVQMTAEEATQLRDTALRSKQPDLSRDLNVYIRKIDPSARADTFERGPSREDQLRRYAAGM